MSDPSPRLRSTLRSRALLVLVVAGAAAAGACRTEPERASHLSTAVKRAPKNPLAGTTRAHLDHSAYFKTDIASPQEVTKRCLECHENAASQVM